MTDITLHISRDGNEWLVSSDMPAIHGTDNSLWNAFADYGAVLEEHWQMLSEDADNLGPALAAEYEFLKPLFERVAT